MTGYGPYPPEWHDGTIQARVRELAGYACEICGLRFDPASNTALDGLDADGRPIAGHVHHLDHNPANNADSNLIYLCRDCHIRLHGQGWLPGGEMPVSWGNEPPPWVLRRGLAYRPNPVVASLQESARYATRRQDRAQFLAGLIEGQGWISGAVDPLAEMRALLKAVLAEYEILLDQRERAAQAPLLAAAAQWAADHRYVTAAEAQAICGLSATEFDVALAAGLITPEPPPHDAPLIPPYFDPARLTLDDAARQAITAKVLLTREQALDYLGVPVGVFERRRREAGIRHVQSRRDASGDWERLYRKVDVDKLRR